MHNSTKRNVLKLLSTFSHLIFTIIILLGSNTQTIWAKSLLAHHSEYITGTNHLMEDNGHLDGKVLDEKDLPLIGVTIQVRESGSNELKKTGTTNIDGSF